MRRVHIIAALSLIPLALMSGCGSDPAPPPEGGFVLHFTTSMSGEGTCMVQEHNGSVWSGTELPSSSNFKGEVADGAKGAMIECSVVPKGKAFTLSGEASLDGYSLSFNVASFSSANTCKTSPCGPGDNPAHGTVGYASAMYTTVSFTSPDSMPCDFYLTGAEEKVDAGRMWMSFDCPVLVDAHDTCSAQSGVVVFEQCDQLATE